MAYISTENVKVKRNQLKKEFPSKDGWKLSVTNDHHSTIMVSILEGPINMIEGDSGYEQVNHYWIDDHYGSRPEVKNILTRILEIISSDQMTVVYDSDYGSIPNFYCRINIGRWDRPYKQVRK